jgi:hypothetical protein
MALEQDILSLGFDVPKAEADKAKIIAIINEVIAKAEQFGEMKLAFGDPTAGLVAFTKANKEYAESLKVTDKVTKEHITNLENLSKATQANEKAKQSQLNTELKEAKVITENTRQRKIQTDIDLKYQKQNDATVRQIVKEEKEIENLSNDYLQLSKAYNEASLKAKNLQLIAPGSNAAKEASAEAKKLSDLLKATDAAVGQNQRNVGNYFEAIQGAFSKTFGFFRTVANIIPGLGLSGLFLGIYEGIQLVVSSGGIQALIHNLFNIKDAYQELVDKRTMLNEVQAEANKNAGKEVADLKILYATATDVNVSMNERRAAVAALKKEFPDYFANIDTETILNGKAKKAYDALSLSIVEVARATAAKAKIDEIESKKLDLEYERRKIRNANDQELANAKDKNLGQEGGGFEKGTGTKSVIYTKQEQQADALQRRKRALDENNDNYERLTRQETFLVQFAGGTSKIAKAIETENSSSKAAREKRAKDEKDYYIETLKAQKEANTAYYEGQAELYKSIYTSEKESYGVRLDALHGYQTVSLKMLEVQKNDELKIIDEKTKEDLNKHNLTKGQIADILKTQTAERLKVENEYLKSVQKLRLDDAKEEISLREKELASFKNFDNRTAAEREKAAYEVNQLLRKMTVDGIEDTMQRQLATIATNSSKEEQALAEQYKRGKINREKYERELVAIQKKAALDALKEQIKALEREIEVMDIGSQARQDAEVKLQALKAKFAKDEIDFTRTQQQEKAAVVEEYINKVKSYYSQVADLAEGVINIGIVKEKNALKELDDQRQKNYENELERIQNSTLSETDKAAKVSVLEAKRNAEKEQSARKQKELDERQAKFQKAQNIANIIFETASAVVHQLATGDPYTAFARAAVVGALGAAKLAIAIATPIAKYAKGTPEGGHKGGLALYGEAGPEVVEEPGKKPYIVDKPTVSFLPRATRVTPLKSDEINAMMYKGMAVQTANVITEGNKPAKDETTEYLKQIANQLNGKPQNTKHTFRVYNNSRWDKWNADIDRSVRGR